VNTQAVPFEITRELYDALMATREPVKIASAAVLLSGDGARAQQWATLLDRIDGALAEAGDYITRGDA